MTRRTTTQLLAAALALLAGCSRTLRIAEQTVAPDLGAPADLSLPGASDLALPKADAGLNCPDPANPKVHYVNNSYRDPAKCTAILFQCTMGQTSCDDACGCGCLDERVVL